MKKIFLLILMCQVCLSAVADTKTISQLLVSIPDTVLPYFKSDMLSAAMKRNVDGEFTPAKNAFDENFCLEALNDSYIRIKTDNDYTLSMRVLPLEGGEHSVVCVVKTFDTEVPFSIIRFYSETWEDLGDGSNIGMLPTVDPLSLVVIPDSISPLEQSELRNSFSIALLLANLSEDKAELTLEASLSGVNKEKKDKLDEIKVLKNIKWNGKIFK